MFFCYVLTEGERRGRESTSWVSADGIYPSEIKSKESAFSTTEEHYVLNPKPHQYLEVTGY